MEYFMETSGTIPDGMGFSLFDRTHICWLAAFLIITVGCCFWYRRLEQNKRSIWNKSVAVLLLLDEVYKMIVLFIGGNYSWGYLPLHLCSINIFFIVWHAWKPTKLIDNFLYTICIPGTLAALLFPSWTRLPALNAMHIHSFTVHILLALYPIVLTVAGEIRPDWRTLPKCIGFLLLLAGVIYGANLALDTNFMFLMGAGKGNPLYWFEKSWGSHLWGFAVIVPSVLIVMYLPLELYRMRYKKNPKTE